MKLKLKLKKQDEILLEKFINRYKRLGIDSLFVCLFVVDFFELEFFVWEWET
ncbi:hypothetical protein KAI52_03195 [Candidatus Parcubacteria bacterium]|nr:hypothetical protein [Candidatus Parcubacteria bacterium]